MALFGSHESQKREHKKTQGTKTLARTMGMIFITATLLSGGQKLRMENGVKLPPTTAADRVIAQLILGLSGLKTSDRLVATIPSLLGIYQGKFNHLVRLMGLAVRDIP
jgi:hypothetical protein